MKTTDLINAASSKKRVTVDANTLLSYLEKAQYMLQNPNGYSSDQPARLSLILADLISSMEINE